MAFGASILGVASGDRNPHHAPVMIAKIGI
jgi:hypothetical protein